MSPEKESYTDGIRQAEQEGHISYHNCSQDTFGPYDKHSFLAEKNGRLSNANTRELASYTRPFVSVFSDAWKRYKEGCSIQCLAPGPGAGTELEELRLILPDELDLETLSLTPINPYYQLQYQVRGIHQKLSMLCQQSFGTLSIDPDSTLTMNAVWENRHALEGVFSDRHSEPFPRHQHIAEFPEGMRTIMPDMPQYQMMVENLGPAYHSIHNGVLADMYHLLARDGAMFVVNWHNGQKLESLSAALRSNDVLMHGHRSTGSLLVLRSDSPLKEILSAKLPGSRGIHAVEDVDLWIKEATNAMTDHR